MSEGLSATNIVYIADNRAILDDVGIEIVPGRVTAVVGPNGAGKSTLLKILAGDLVPRQGDVRLNDRPLSAWRSDALACCRAVLPQSPELAFHFRVWEVVELGRHPHRGRATADEDRAAIAEAMAATETERLATRDCRTLSGGERHRTHYARVLAQLWRRPGEGETRILLLDEPTAGLDLFHQHAILTKARDVASEGVGVLAVLHDLNLASLYADEIVVLARGRIDAVGTPIDVLTAERIKRIWRVPCEIAKGCNGNPHVTVLPPSCAIQRTA